MVVDPAALREQRQFYFNKLKQDCIPLLSLSSRLAASASSPRLSHTSTLQHLTSLQRTISSITPLILSSNLSNYVIFPLLPLLSPSPTSTAQPTPDRVLEAIFKVLTVLVEKWREIPDGGMEEQVRVQLWILCTLKLGGPIPTGGEASLKGKEKEQEKKDQMSEESTTAALELLLALVKPLNSAAATKSKVEEDEDDPLGVKIDWDSPTSLDPIDSLPSLSKPLKPPKPSPPALPILFHTLTTLLSLSSTTSSLQQLQQTALEALEVLLKACFYPEMDEPPSALLATALPGIMSTLSRIALSLPSSSTPTQYQQSTTATTTSLTLITSVLLHSISDTFTSQILPSPLPLPTSLDSLILSTISSTPSPPPPEPSSSTASNQPQPPTPAWLKATLSSLTPLISSLSSRLSSHPQSVIRISLVGLIKSLLATSKTSFSLTTTNSTSSLGVEDSPTTSSATYAMIKALLLCSVDDWPDVQMEATKVLSEIIGEYSSGVEEVVRVGLKSLSSKIKSGDESGLRKSLTTIRGGLGVLEGSEEPLEIERWGHGLLAALEVSLVPIFSPSFTSNLTTNGKSLISFGEGGDGEFPDPRLRLISEKDTVKEVVRMFNSFGKFSGALGVGEWFLGIVTSGIAVDGKRVSAAWVLGGVVEGLVASADERGKKKGKNKRKKWLKSVTKTLLGVLKELEEDGLEEQEEVVLRSGAGEELRLKEESEDVGGALEIVRETPSMTPSLDLFKPSTSIPSKQSEQQQKKDFLRAFLSKILASVSGSSEEGEDPYRAQIVYHLLAFIDSTNPFLASYARHSLFLLSPSPYSSTSTNNQQIVSILTPSLPLLLSHLSLTLHPSSLSLSSPRVLQTLIGIFGRKIVPMMSDMVEDLMECLDDWHGYEVVLWGIWGVVGGLVSVLASEEENGAKEEEEEDSQEEKDWKRFEEWWEMRQKEKLEAEEDPPEPELNPRKPFAPPPPSSQLSPDDPDNANGEEDQPKSEEPKIQPTPEQELAQQILSKSVYFLNHGDFRLRARILELMSGCIKIFCCSSPPLSSSSSADSPHPNGVNHPGGNFSPSSTKNPTNPEVHSLYLPAIHRAWPYILPRLSPSEHPSVILSALALLSTLCIYSGDYMARRMSDDCWPLVSKLVFSTEKGGASETRLRLLKGVMFFLTQFAKFVPIKEDLVWDVAVAFRGFLAEEGVRVECEELFRALKKVNEDVVWVVVRGVVGGEDGEEVGELGWLKLGGERKVEREVMDRIFQ